MPDPHPDSPPEADNDEREDMERAQTPLEPTGQPDGNAGTGGETKNQNDLAQ